MLPSLNLNKLVSSKPMGLFRILFGMIMAFQFFKFSKRISFFEDPEYLYFPYPELDWVPVISVDAMWLVFGLGCAATLLFTVGFFYKYAAAVMTLVYGYFFCLDSVYYNNHYYLIFLLGLLMIFTRADASLVPITKNRKEYISNWQYVILQLQIGIVFFYGGLSKLNTDWINGKIINQLTESDTLNQVLNYGGLAFDLFIPFLLFSKKYRWYAIIAVILFNVSNHFLFDDIAAFPILVIASMLLFIVEGSMPSWMSKWVTSDSDKENDISSIAKCALVAFFAFQLIFPLRHLAISDHVDWSGQGHYFSWRMKSYHKNIDATFYAHDLLNNKRLYDINHGIEDYKVQHFMIMPHMVVRIAQKLKNKIDLIDGLNPGVGISVDYNVAFNGRESELAIRPDFDVSSANFSKYGNNDWIIPFKKYK